MYPTPTPNQDASSVLSASVWRDIFDMLNWWKRSKSRRSDANPSRTRDGRVWVSNDAGRDITVGELVQIQSMTQPTDSTLGTAFAYSPILSGDEPVWHTEIENIVPAQGDVPDGQMFPLSNKNWGIVSCTGAVGAVERYVMPNPTTPKYGTVSSSGLFRVLGYDSTNDLAVVDLTQSQPIWRYELTQDSLAPGATTAKLLTLDGSEFASEINMQDPFGVTKFQDSGEEGFCEMVGNHFYAKQPAPATREVITDFVVGASSITVSHKNILVYGSEDLPNDVITGSTCP